MATLDSADKIRKHFMIPDGYVSPYREGTDLFIGRGRALTIELRPDANVHFDRVVVLGTLHICCTEPVDNSHQPHFSAKQVFLPENITLSQALFSGIATPPTE